MGTVLQNRYIHGARALSILSILNDKMNPRGKARWSIVSGIVLVALMLCVPANLKTQRV